MEPSEDYLDEIRYIGLRIAYFRKLRGLTQEKLADKVYINRERLDAESYFPAAADKNCEGAGSGTGAAGRFKRSYALEE